MIFPLLCFTNFCFSLDKIPHRCVMVTTDTRVTNPRYSVYNTLKKPAFSVFTALELRHLTGGGL